MKQTIEDGKIVERYINAVYSYDINAVKSEISSLERELEKWREYESLLTSRAADLPKRCPVCGTSIHGVDANGFVVQNTANR